MTTNTRLAVGVGVVALVLWLKRSPVPRPSWDKARRDAAERDLIDGTFP